MNATKDRTKIDGEYKNIQYTAIKGGESWFYTLILNGVDVTDKVLSCNPDPDSPGELRGEDITHTDVEYAIKSCIDCWLLTEINLSLKMGDYLLMQLFLEDGRELVQAYIKGCTGVEVMESIVRREYKEKLTIIETLIQTLDNQVEGKNE